MNNTPPRYLDRPAAAAYCCQLGLQVSPKTLGKWAVIGGGPTYHKFGRRAVYTQENLDRWIQERLGQPVCSTSGRGD